MDEITTVRLKRTTKTRLDEIMFFGETFDDKINKLVDLYHITTRPKIQPHEPKESSGSDWLFG